ncbi:MAG: oligosaccharide flippase family protein [Polyangiaceae bacterium]
MLWGAVENGGLALVSFASLIVYSRFLSPADFGLFSIVLSVIELLGVLVSMLFHDALVQKDEVTSLHFDSAFTFTLGLSLVLFGACMLAQPWFAGLVDSPRAASALAWTALALPATAATATLVPQQRRELAFRPLALRSLVGRLTGAAVGIGLVVLGVGFWALVAQHVLIAFTGSLVLWLTAAARPRLRLGRAELRQLLGYGGYAVGSLFLSFAVKRVFTILVGVSLGSEAAGHMSLEFRAVDVLWAIAAGAMTQVALPVRARLQNDPARLEQAYHSATQLTCLVLYPCFLGLAVVAPEVVELLFGAGWASATPYVSALAVLIVVQVPRVLIGALLGAVGRPRDTLIGVLLDLGLMLGLMLWLGSRSLDWAIGIWMLREVAVAPVMALVLERATGITLVRQLRGVLVPLLASLTMALCVHVLSGALPSAFSAAERLIVLAPFGAAVFLACAWLVDRKTLARGFDFASSAVRRVRRDPVPG